MSQPYVGEIRMFAGNYAPSGWMFCEGQLLAISEYEALFNLIGTIYGGDGVNRFALPDLRGRLPLHQSIDFRLGQQGGVESVTLTVAQTPAHSHAFMVSQDIANSPNPSANVVARSPQVHAFINANPSVAMSPTFIGSAGGSQPHGNFQPYLCIDFIIALFGVYPSQT